MYDMVYIFLHVALAGQFAKSVLRWGCFLGYFDTESYSCFNPVHLHHKDCVLHQSGVRCCHQKPKLTGSMSLTESAISPNELDY